MNVKRKNNKFLTKLLLAATVLVMALSGGGLLFVGNNNGGNSGVYADYQIPSYTKANSIGFTALDTAQTATSDMGEIQKGDFVEDSTYTGWTVLIESAEDLFRFSYRLSGRMEYLGESTATGNNAREHYRKRNYILTRNIDFSSYPYPLLPISMYEIAPFEGVLDGQGYEIRGIHLEGRNLSTGANNYGDTTVNSSYSSFSFFGFNLGTIRRLGIVNPSLNTQNFGIAAIYDAVKQSPAAGFISNNMAGGTIESCFVNNVGGGIINSVTKSAGFCVRNAGTISNIYVAGSFTAPQTQAIVLLNIGSVSEAYYDSSLFSGGSSYATGASTADLKARNNGVLRGSDDYDGLGEAFYTNCFTSGDSANYLSGYPKLYGAHFTGTAFTSATVYTIRRPADLAALPTMIANGATNKTFYLGNSIDMCFIPTGAYVMPANFTGTFGTPDGASADLFNGGAYSANNAYSILGLTVNTSGSHIGMFQSSGAITIKNLNIVAGTAVRAGGSSVYASMLVSNAGGAATMTNVHVDAEVRFTSATSTNAYIGGLLGRGVGAVNITGSSFHGSLNNSTRFASSGNFYAGGIAGYLGGGGTLGTSTAIVQNSQSAGKALWGMQNGGLNSYTGGIAGYAGGTFTSVFAENSSNINLTNASGQHTNVYGGGIFGRGPDGGTLDNSGTVKSVLNSGTLNVYEYGGTTTARTIYVGGIAGISGAATYKGLTQSDIGTINLVAGTVTNNATALYIGLAVAAGSSGASGNAATPSGTYPIFTDCSLDFTSSALSFTTNVSGAVYFSGLGFSNQTFTNCTLKGGITLTANNSTHTIMAGFSAYGGNYTSCKLEGALLTLNAKGTNAGSKALGGFSANAPNSARTYSDCSVDAASKLDLQTSGTGNASSNLFLGGFDARSTSGLMTSYGSTYNGTCTFAGTINLNHKMSNMGYIYVGGFTSASAALNGTSKFVSGGTDKITVDIKGTTSLTGIYFGGIAGDTATLAGADNSFSENLTLNLDSTTGTISQHIFFGGIAGKDATLNGTSKYSGNIALNFGSYNKSVGSTTAGHGLYFGGIAGNKATLNGSDNSYSGDMTLDLSAAGASATHIYRLYFGGLAGYEVETAAGSVTKYGGAIALNISSGASAVYKGGFGTTATADGGIHFGGLAGKTATLKGNNSFSKPMSLDFSNYTGKTVSNVFFGGVAGETATVTGGTVFDGSAVTLTTGAFTGGTIGNIYFGGIAGKTATMSGGSHFDSDAVTLNAAGFAGTVTGMYFGGIAGETAELSGALLEKSYFSSDALLLNLTGASGTVTELNFGGIAGKTATMSDDSYFNSGSILLNATNFSGKSDSLNFGGIAGQTATMSGSSYFASDQTIELRATGYTGAVGGFFYGGIAGRSADMSGTSEFRGVNSNSYVLLTLLNAAGSIGTATTGVYFGGIAGVNATLTGSAKYGGNAVIFNTTNTSTRIWNIYYGGIAGETAELSGAGNSLSLDSLSLTLNSAMGAMTSVNMGGIAGLEATLGGASRFKGLTGDAANITLDLGTYNNTITTLNMGGVAGKTAALNGTGAANTNTYSGQILLDLSKAGTNANITTLNYGGIAGQTATMAAGSVSSFTGGIELRTSHPATNPTTTYKGKIGTLYFGGVAGQTANLYGTNNSFNGNVTFNLVGDMEVTKAVYMGGLAGHTATLGANSSTDSVTKYGGTGVITFNIANGKNIGSGAAGDGIYYGGIAGHTATLYGNSVDGANSFSKDMSLNFTGMSGSPLISGIHFGGIAGHTASLYGRNRYTGNISLTFEQSGSSFGGSIGNSATGNDLYFGGVAGHLAQLNGTNNSFNGVMTLTLGAAMQAVSNIYMGGFAGVTATFSTTNTSSRTGSITLNTQTGTPSAARTIGDIFFGGFAGNGTNLEAGMGSYSGAATLNLGGGASAINDIYFGGFAGNTLTSAANNNSQMTGKVSFNFKSADSAENYSGTIRHIFHGALAGYSAVLAGANNSYTDTTELKLALGESTGNVGSISFGGLAGYTVTLSAANNVTKNLSAVTLITHTGTGTKATIGTINMGGLGGRAASLSGTGAGANTYARDVTLRLAERTGNMTTSLDTNIGNAGIYYGGLTGYTLAITGANNTNQYTGRVRLLTYEEDGGNKTNFFEGNISTLAFGGLCGTNASMSGSGADNSYTDMTGAGITLDLAKTGAVSIIYFGGLSGFTATVNGSGATTTFGKSAAGSNLTLETHNGRTTKVNIGSIYMGGYGGVNATLPTNGVNSYTGNVTLNLNESTNQITTYLYLGGFAGRSLTTNANNVATVSGKIELNVSPAFTGIIGSVVGAEGVDDQGGLYFGGLAGRDATLSGSNNSILARTPASENIIKLDILNAGNIPNIFFGGLAGRDLTIDAANSTTRVLRDVTLNTHAAGGGGSIYRLNAGGLAGRDVLNLVGTAATATTGANGFAGTLTLNLNATTTAINYYLNFGGFAGRDLITATDSTSKFSGTIALNIASGFTGAIGTDANSAVHGIFMGGMAGRDASLSGTDNSATLTGGLNLNLGSAGVISGGVYFGGMAGRDLAFYGTTNASKLSGDVTLKTQSGGTASRIDNIFMGGLAGRDITAIQGTGANHNSYDGDVTLNLNEATASVYYYLYLGGMAGRDAVTGTTVTTNQTKYTGKLTFTLQNPDTNGYYTGVIGGSNNTTAQYGLYYGGFAGRDAILRGNDNSLTNGISLDLLRCGNVSYLYVGGIAGRDTILYGTTAITGTAVTGAVSVTTHNGGDTNRTLYSIHVGGYAGNNATLNGTAAGAHSYAGDVTLTLAPRTTTMSTSLYFGGLAGNTLTTVTGNTTKYTGQVYLDMTQSSAVFSSSAYIYHGGLAGYIADLYGDDNSYDKPMNLTIGATVGTVRYLYYGGLAGYNVHLGGSATSTRNTASVTKYGGAASGAGKDIRLTVDNRAIARTFERIYFGSLSGNNAFLYGASAEANSCYGNAHLKVGSGSSLQYLYYGGLTGYELTTAAGTTSKFHGKPNIDISEYNNTMTILSYGGLVGYRAYLYGDDNSYGSEVNKKDLSLTIPASMGNIAQYLRFGGLAGHTVSTASATAAACVTKYFGNITMSFESGFSSNIGTSGTDRYGILFGGLAGSDVTVNGTSQDANSYSGNVTLNLGGITGGYIRTIMLGGMAGSSFTTSGNTSTNRYTGNITLNTENFKGNIGVAAATQTYSGLFFGAIAGGSATLTGSEHSYGTALASKTLNLTLRAGMGDISNIYFGGLAGYSLATRNTTASVTTFYGRLEILTAGYTGTLSRTVAIGGLVGGTATRITGINTSYDYPVYLDFHSGIGYTENTKLYMGGFAGQAITNLNQGYPLFNNSVTLDFAAAASAIPFPLVQVGGISGGTATFSTADATNGTKTYSHEVTVNFKGSAAVTTARVGGLTADAVTLGVDNTTATRLTYNGEVTVNEKQTGGITSLYVGGVSGGDMTVHRNTWITLAAPANVGDYNLSLTDLGGVENLYFAGLAAGTVNSQYADARLVNQGRLLCRGAAAGEAVTNAYVSGISSGEPNETFTNNLNTGTMAGTMTVDTPGGSGTGNWYVSGLTYSTSGMINGGANSAAVINVNNYGTNNVYIAGITNNIYSPATTSTALTLDNLNFSGTVNVNPAAAAGSYGVLAVAGIYHNTSGGLHQYTATGCVNRGTFNINAATSAGTFRFGGIAATATPSAQAAYTSVITGSVTDATVTGSLTLSGNAYIGGIAADLEVVNASDTVGTINDCYNMKDFTLALKGAAATRIYAGGIVGNYRASKLSITNCYAAGAPRITRTTGGLAASFDLGGIAGRLAQTHAGADAVVIDNNFTNASIAYSDSPAAFDIHIGGIVGSFDSTVAEAKITNSSAGGAPGASKDIAVSVSMSGGTLLYVGGIVGGVIGANGITIEGCFSHGVIDQLLAPATSNSVYVGGLAGSVLGKATINRSINFAEIEHHTGTGGGIAGFAATVSMNGVANHGNVFGTGGATATGGILGMSGSGTVTGAFVYGHIAAASGVAGGLVGTANGALTFVNSIFVSGEIDDLSVQGSGTALTATDTYTTALTDAKLPPANSGYFNSASNVGKGGIYNNKFKLIQLANHDADYFAYSDMGKSDQYWWKDPVSVTSSRNIYAIANDIRKNADYLPDNLTAFAPSTTAAAEALVVGDDSIISSLIELSVQIGDAPDNEIFSLALKEQTGRVPEVLDKGVLKSNEVYGDATSLTRLALLSGFTGESLTAGDAYGYIYFSLNKTAFIPTLGSAVDGSQTKFTFYFDSWDTELLRIIPIETSPDTSYTVMFDDGTSNTVNDGQKVAKLNVDIERTTGRQSTYTVIKVERDDPNNTGATSSKYWVIELALLDDTPRIEPFDYSVSGRSLVWDTATYDNPSERFQFDHVTYTMQMTTYDVAATAATAHTQGAKASASNPPVGKTFYDNEESSDSVFDFYSNNTLTSLFTEVELSVLAATGRQPSFIPHDGGYLEAKLITFFYQAGAVMTNNVKVQYYNDARELAETEDDDDRWEACPEVTINGGSAIAVDTSKYDPIQMAGEGDVLYIGEFTVKAVFPESLKWGKYRIVIQDSEIEGSTSVSFTVVKAPQENDEFVNDSTTAGQQFRYRTAGLNGGNYSTSTASNAAAQRIRFKDAPATTVTGSVFYGEVISNPASSALKQAYVVTGSSTTLATAGISLVYGDYPDLSFLADSMRAGKTIEDSTSTAGLLRAYNGSNNNSYTAASAVPTRAVMETPYKIVNELIEKEIEVIHYTLPLEGGQVQASDKEKVTVWLNRTVFYFTIESEMSMAKSAKMNQDPYYTYYAVEYYEAAPQTGITSITRKTYPATSYSSVASSAWRDLTVKRTDLRDEFKITYAAGNATTGDYLPDISSTEARRKLEVQRVGSAITIDQLDPEEKPTMKTGTTFNTSGTTTANFVTDIGFYNDIDKVLSGDYSAVKGYITRYGEYVFSSKVKAYTKNLSLNFGSDKDNYPAYLAYDYVDVTTVPGEGENPGTTTATKKTQVLINGEVTPENPPTAYEFKLFWDEYSLSSVKITREANRDSYAGWAYFERNPSALTSNAPIPPNRALDGDGNEITSRPNRPAIDFYAEDGEYIYDSYGYPLSYIDSYSGEVLVSTDYRDGDYRTKYILINASYSFDDMSFSGYAWLQPRDLYAKVYMEAFYDTGEDTISLKNPYDSEVNDYYEEPVMYYDSVRGQWVVNAMSEGMPTLPENQKIKFMVVAEDEEYTTLYEIQLGDGLADKTINLEIRVPQNNAPTYLYVTLFTCLAYKVGDEGGVPVYEDRVTRATTVLYFDNGAVGTYTDGGVTYDVYRFNLANHVTARYGIKVHAPPTYKAKLSVDDIYSFRLPSGTLFGNPYLDLESSDFDLTGEGSTSAPTVMTVNLAVTMVPVIPPWGIYENS